MDSQNNIIEEKKGNKTLIIIIIVVVLLIVIGLGIYFLYGKSETTNNDVTTSTTEKEDNTKIESVTFTDKELEEYINHIVPTDNALLFNADKVNVSSLTTKEKINYIGSYLYSNFHTSSADYEYNIISESDLKSTMEKIYGENSYEKTTFTLGCGEYTLKDDGNYYSISGCGGTTSTFVSNVVIDYTATKDKLEITTAYAIYDYTNNKIYKDYNLTNPLASYTNEDNGETKTYVDQYVKDNKDKLSTLVYTFESTDGVNYYFTGLVNNK